MGQLGIDQDARVTERLLSEAPVGTKINMSTGYFNLTQQYMKTLTYNSIAHCNLLFAHPNVRTVTF